MTDNTHTDNEGRTKSSGELEEILDKLVEYIRGENVNGSFSENCKCEKCDRYSVRVRKHLRKIIATQTTKLQAEARIENSKYLLQMARDYEKGLGVFLENTELSLVEALVEHIAQLEREHKIGEDGE